VALSDLPRRRRFSIFSKYSKQNPHKRWGAGKIIAGSGAIAGGVLLTIVFPPVGIPILLCSAFGGGVAIAHGVQEIRAKRLQKRQEKEANAALDSAKDEQIIVGLLQLEVEND